MLAAKAIVFTATSLVVGIGSSVAAWFAFQASLPDDSLRARTRHGHQPDLHPLP